MDIINLREWRGKENESESVPQLEHIVYGLDS